MGQNITERHRQTRNRVLRILFDSTEPRTKQQIVTELGLSLPTVHQSLLELGEEGLIDTCGQEQSTGGRPAALLTIAKDSRISLGIQVTEHHLHLLAVNLRLEEIASKSVRHGPAADANELGSCIASELESFIDESEINRDLILGVGVAIPGIIDEGSDTVSLAPTLHMGEFPLSLLSSHIPYPTLFGNDANLGGLAEWYARPDMRSIAYLSLEGGVGGAILLDGVTYTGENGRSGEFGHICVERGGRLCDCGKHGCLEAYCSSRRLSDDLGITLGEFFASLDRGEGEAVGIWEDYVEHLAIGIGTIRMALDCDIVLGGAVVEYLGPRLGTIREQVAALDMFGGDAGYVHLSRHPRHAVQLGAALRCVDAFVQAV